MIENNETKPFRRRWCVTTIVSMMMYLSFAFSIENERPIVRAIPGQVGAIVCTKLGQNNG